MFKYIPIDSSTKINLSLITEGKYEKLLIARMNSEELFDFAVKLVIRNCLYK